MRERASRSGPRSTASTRGRRFDLELHGVQQPRAPQAQLAPDGAESRRRHGPELGTPPPLPPAPTPSTITNSTRCRGRMLLLLGTPCRHGRLEVALITQYDGKTQCQSRHYCHFPC